MRRGLVTVTTRSPISVRSRQCPKGEEHRCVEDDEQDGDDDDDDNAVVAGVGAGVGETASRRRLRSEGGLRRSANRRQWRVFEGCLRRISLGFQWVDRIHETSPHTATYVSLRKHQ